MTKEFGEIHDDSITSVLFQKNDGNKILTYSSDGSMKIFDIRMEKTLKKFEESSYMQSMSSLGNSRALFSSGGQLVVLMTPTGQIVAFDANTE
jgi:WD40 repeat protein